MLQFSANLSLLFTEYPLLQRFEQAKKAGFDTVEIQFPYTESVADIKQALQQHQLTLVLFNIAADDLLQGGEGLAAVPHKQPQFKQALEQAVAYAEILQPQLINVLPGCAKDEHIIQLYLDTFCNNLQLALDAFSPLGIKTVFEAINTHDMPGFLIYSSQHMLKIQKQINHPDLKLQYDIYHMVRMGEQPLAFIQQHVDKIGHIQFADCPGRRQPGTGQIEFSALFDLIKKSNYCGWVGAEYHPTATTLSSLDWFNH